jgi:hypothetical protein
METNNMKLDHFTLFFSWLDGVYHTDTYSLLFFIVVLTLGIVYDTLRLTVAPRRNIA